MASEVIVTLQTDTFNRDFALPDSVALKELYPRLLAALQNASSTRFVAWKGVLLETEQGALLDLNATLADYGICTGKYLFVVEEDWNNGI